MIYLFPVYVVLVGFCFIGLLWLRRKVRRTKHPLGEDVKLRRQPGEHLRMECGKKLESLLTWLVAISLVPGLAFFMPAVGLNPFVSIKHPELMMTTSLTIMAILIVLVVIWAFFWGIPLTEKIMNLRLAWFGERVVADQLEVLKRQGYSVFHDVPCQGSTGPFNLDHVVVGNGCVVVVETKTRRKPKGDSAGHKVTYDGVKLTWPWGQSTKEIDQVLRCADWLKKEIKKQLNLDVNVRSALTMPGWFVTGGPPQAPVLVENPMRLPRYISQRFVPQLCPEQTDLVTRYLERQCMDLSYEMM